MSRTPQERLGARELRQEFAAALPHRAGEVRFVIGEIQERRGRGEFLALEQHRRARHEQEQRRHRARAAWDW